MAGKLLISGLAEAGWIDSSKTLQEQRCLYKGQIYRYASEWDGGQEDQWKVEKGRKEKTSENVTGSLSMCPKRGMHKRHHEKRAEMKPNVGENCKKKQEIPLKYLLYSLKKRCFDQKVDKKISSNVLFIQQKLKSCWKLETGKSWSGIYMHLIYIHAWNKNKPKFKCRHLKWACCVVTRDSN